MHPHFVSPQVFGLAPVCPMCRELRMLVFVSFFILGENRSLALYSPPTMAAAAAACRQSHCASHHLSRTRSHKHMLRQNVFNASMHFHLAHGQIFQSIKVI
ncbi:hypothetical protein CRENBAI_007723 [Crenichthys baileyi]|uniref:Secreted protein n=1 Tax=Crenichthys baileyi TaxID=28760 RepID=A0AAV9S7Q9_9TELE